MDSITQQTVAVATLITSFAAFLTALTAIFGQFAQGRRSRFPLGLASLQRFSDRFSSPAFCRKRSVAATLILRARQSHGLPIQDKITLEACATDILDLFEEIGVLLRRKILDKQLTDIEFTYWIVMYWHLFEDQRATSRADDPEIWEDAEWLHTQMTHYESRRRGHKKFASPTDPELLEFLQEEMSLELPTSFRAAQQLAEADSAGGRKRNGA